MGWASGSEILEQVWKIVRPLTYPGENRRKTAKRLIEIFENADCDTVSECVEICKDAGIYQD